MEPEFIFFLLLALVAVASALAMLTARNPVYSAIFLILNFSTIAVFYLLLNAPFIAMAQIAVYAGAIMVLFLFVMMLLGAEEFRGEQMLPWQRPLAVLMGVVLVGLVGYLFISQGRALAPPDAPAEGFGGPHQIGASLFTDYLLPFEITGILLLVAMIGAIFITQKERFGRRKAVWVSEAIEGRQVPGDGRKPPARELGASQPPVEVVPEDRPAAGRPKP
jgi:NADH-quinone oxidoreductase subunit J